VRQQPLRARLLAAKSAEEFYQTLCAAEGA